MEWKSKSRNKSLTLAPANSTGIGRWLGRADVGQGKHNEAVLRGDEKLES